MTVDDTKNTLLCFALDNLATCVNQPGRGPRSRRCQYIGVLRRISYRIRNIFLDVARPRSDARPDF
eukprot:1079562-Pyramimonas_sp.AAC.1